MPVPDYLASLAELETYPDTLIADIAAEYDTDIASYVGAADALNLTIATQAATIEALQSTNALLIASVGVTNAPAGSGDGNDDPDDNKDEGDVSYDDLLEDESE